MPDLVITSSTGVVIGAALTVGIGEKADWRLAGDSGEIATAAQWVFGTAGFAVGNYEPGDEDATVTAFVGGGSSGLFYWAEVGVVVLTISAAIGGQRYSRDVTVTVTAPSVLSLRSTLTSSRIISRAVGGRVDDIRDHFSFGDFSSQVPANVGCRTTARVRTTGSAGKLSFLQLMKVNRSKVSTEASENVTIASAGFTVDEEFHYGIDPNDGGEDMVLTIAATETKDVTTEDSPMTVAYHDRSLRNYVTITVSEEFKIFMMFKPTGGIWVAIAEVHWNWGKKATYNSDTEVWLLENNVTTQENTVRNMEIGVTRLPVWSENSRDRDLLG